jgi:hypothetical protein
MAEDLRVRDRSVAIPVAPLPAKAMLLEAPPSTRLGRGDWTLSHPPFGDPNLMAVR